MTRSTSIGHRSVAFPGSAFVPGAPLLLGRAGLGVYPKVSNEQFSPINTELNFAGNQEDSKQDGVSCSQWGFEEDFPNEVGGTTNTAHDEQQGNIQTQSSSRPKKNLATAMVSLLCSTAFIFGNFHAYRSSAEALTLSQNEAFGTTKTTYTDMIPQLSTSSITSEKLFQSLSTNEMQRSQSSPSTPQNRRQKYWDAQEKGTLEETSFANEKLIDHLVSTINTMYYDSSGGANFDPREFYSQWKEFKLANRENLIGATGKNDPNIADNAFATRENAVKAMKKMVLSLNDPYSKYLTREELRLELEGRDDGFLGLGALVEAPTLSTSSTDSSQKNAMTSSQTKAKDFSAFFSLDKFSSRGWYGQWDKFPTGTNPLTDHLFKNPRYNNKSMAKHGKTNDILTVKEAINLPVVKAIVPDSPAERAGIVVGDRIASVGSYQFTGMSRSQVKAALDSKFHASNYFGRADLTIAKPILVRLNIDGLGSKFDSDGNVVEEKYIFEDGWYHPNNNRRLATEIGAEQVFGYKISRVKSIPTTITAGSFHPGDSSTQDSLQLSASSSDPSNDIFSLASTSLDNNRKISSVIGGDAIVHYELLTPADSIFQHVTGSPSQPVGYIRLTRFSKASTAGYINAVNQLEEAGAKSYILDLRNNYGGVIQEAMLTASTLLKDPHLVLCYTLNTRGGFKPQENMEYIVDRNYPGYLLSSEPRSVSRDQVQREHPEYLEEDGWTSPTSYASLNELRLTRGIKPAHAATLESWQLSGKETAVDQRLQRSLVNSDNSFGKRDIDLEKVADAISRGSQKKLVILINEGTASAAEVFASALHDNGRTVALVGTKTFGKGLIQHTFPMPDGGGLRLTVAEYLTPRLNHVTKVFGAKYDSGIQPDIRCESKQGIPKNIGGDLCVGIALDVLESTGSD